LEIVVAETAEQQVRAFAALDLVVTGTAIQHIVTPAAFELHLIVAGTAEHHVVAAIGLQLIVPTTAVEQGGNIDIEADLTLIIVFTQQDGDLANPGLAVSDIKDQRAGIEVRLCTYTNNYLMPSPAIESPIAPIGLNLACENGDPNIMASYANQGTRPNVIW